MTTAAPRAAHKPIAPDRYERFLAAASLVLLGVVLVALGRGYLQWGQVPGVVWPHLLTIMIALALTPVMLLRRRGDRQHRILGAIWMAAMMATALLSFRVQVNNPGHFTWIHLLSALTLIAVPRALWAAHNHRVVEHRRIIRGLVTGAILIAGMFTLTLNRLLAHWLFG